METLTAYHESGHALMASLLGGRVQSVTIEPDDDDGPRRHGDTRILWPLPRKRRTHARHEILVLLAGPVAEMIYRGEPLHPGFVPQWADDWQRAWTLAEQIHSAHVRRLRQLEQLTAQLHRSMSDDRCWAALAALADELLAHETLDEEMVTDVLSVWLELP
ncbi:M50 family metallopeptidase [Roseimaritima sediminicola]|uniref:M50 family metallopeptidase n=1 Tax=Roseimaritima sediminicola TaxID=2662066 RepID=UPI0012984BF8|nr:M50 family metallopeptidase [Roseimaritima sediminicola]